MKLANSVIVTMTVAVASDTDCWTREEKIAFIKQWAGQSFLLKTMRDHGLTKEEKLAKLLANAVRHYEVSQELRDELAGWGKK